MDQEYSYDIVVNTLANLDRIRSFVERTTHELFPLYYQIEIPEGYRTSEGNTLTDLSPHSTRVPTKDGLQETLLILMSDIERTLSILDPLQRLELILVLDEKYSKRKTSEIPNLASHLREAVEQMVRFLNDGVL